MGTRVGRKVLRTCPGFADLACPHKAILNEGTALLKLHTDKLSLESRCFLCERLRKIERHAQNKFRTTPEGVKLCAMTMSCPNPRAEGAVYCEMHMSLHSSHSRDHRHRYNDARGQISNRLELEKHIDQCLERRSVSEQWVRARELHMTGRVHYIDLEFIRELVVQIAIVDASGEVVFNAVIDYGKSQDELLNGLPGIKQYIENPARERYVKYLRYTLDGFYGGQQSKEIKSIRRLSRTTAALELEELNIKTLSEWSLCWCDIDRLAAFVEEYAPTYRLSRVNGLRALNLVRDEFKLLHVLPMKNAAIWKLLFPSRPQPKAHWAQNDVLMTQEIMDCLFEKYRG